jgi:hypothetical protein
MSGRPARRGLALQHPSYRAVRMTSVAEARSRVKPARSAPSVANAASGLDTPPPLRFTARKGRQADPCQQKR